MQLLKLFRRVRGIVTDDTDIIIIGGREDARTFAQALREAVDQVRAERALKKERHEQTPGL